MYLTDLVGVIILMIPIFAFLIAFVSLPYVEEKIHDEIGRANIISVGILVAAIIMSWFKRDPKSFINTLGILLVSVIILMVSLVEIWTCPEHRIFFLHVRTSLQTVSLTLLAFAVYRFLVDLYGCLNNSDCEGHTGSSLKGTRSPVG